MFRSAARAFRSSLKKLRPISQQATIQGELTFRITDPEKVATTMDFSVDGRGRHKSDDPQKLRDRLIHATQLLARNFVKNVDLAAPIGQWRSVVVAHPRRPYEFAHDDRARCRNHRPDDPIAEANSGNGQGIAGGSPRETLVGSG